MKSGLNWEVDFARVLTKSPWYLVDGDFLYWKGIIFIYLLRHQVLIWN
jgi:hypothetical protein